MKKTYWITYRYNAWGPTMKTQLEVTWKDEAFTLIGDTSQDGERLAREAAQREADKAEAEKQQPALL